MQGTGFANIFISKWETKKDRQTPANTKSETTAAATTTTAQKKTASELPFWLNRRQANGSIAPLPSPTNKCNCKVQLYYEKVGELQ
ncbi:unnamed protein product [Ceratitis capitata]|uniref:(Mediterranean fruit fly) hypothetical protein n=1 Tax=Ceratitis capitata TaxID=7213 RepID=A0A811U733_CERCA|nr:unnamed protein product [Ceratitis capitata]